MTNTPFEVPLSPNPQTFTITLGSIAYQLTVQWRNTFEGGWFIDIADQSGNPIIQGIPLVTGANLLAQYAYTGIQGSLVVQTDSDPDAVPTFDNLGQMSHLFYITAS